MNVKSNTEYLNNKLLKSKDIKNFLNSNSDNLDKDDFHILLLRFMDEKGLSKSDFFESAHINDTTGYHILNGRRLPSRDKVIQMAIALSLNLDETNRLLRKAKHGILYVKDMRDAIIIFSINNSYSLMAVNDLLYDEDCKVLE